MAEMIKEMTTSGDICLEGEYRLVYKIAEISYTEREDESFQYEFRPCYSVISLLSPKFFQGIPGLDLSLRKEVYVRENIIPVFISERSPGRNREDLWNLLAACNMDYLNPLEWLIRTDTRYHGDSLFVKNHEDRSINTRSVRNLGNRSSVICRKVLETICYGSNFSSDELTVDDSDRKEIHDLLLSLYGTERKYIDDQRRVGIRDAAEAGKYKGRKRIIINSPESYEVFACYENGSLSSMEAAEHLGISKSTFLRRYREYTWEKETDGKTRPS